jgi:hypothetical protein
MLKSLGISGDVHMYALYVYALSQLASILVGHIELAVSTDSTDYHKT